MSGARKATPSWSWDGRRVVFVSLRDGSEEIYTVNVDGSAQTNVTNSVVRDIEAAWRPRP